MTGKVKLSGHFFVSTIMGLSVKDQFPPVDLSHYIERYWSGTFNLNHEREFSMNIVPNGCVELILHLSDDHCLLNKPHSSFDKSPPFTLLGVYSKPYTAKFPSRVNAFGIRFYPDGFKNVFGVPPGEFLSTYEDGADVVGKELEHFWSKLRDNKDAVNRVNLANDFLRKQLSKNRIYHDKTHMAMLLIRQSMGLIGFSEITDKVPISLRQLQREFRKNYGITITDYIRLTRLNTANKYILANPGSLTELSYILNFSDQSHFIREFKHYNGLTPKKFLKERLNYVVSTV